MRPLWSAMALSLLASCVQPFARGAVAALLRKVCDEAASEIESTRAPQPRDSSVITDAAIED